MPWPITWKNDGRCSVIGVEALVDHVLELERQAEPAVSLGEVDPGEAHVELGAHELVAVALGVVLGNQLVDQLEHAGLVAAVLSTSTVCVTFGLLVTALRVSKR